MVRRIDFEILGIKGFEVKLKPWKINLSPGKVLEDMNFVQIFAFLWNSCLIYFAVTLFQPLCQLNPSPLVAHKQVGFGVQTDQ